MPNDFHGLEDEWVYGERNLDSLLTRFFRAKVCLGIILWQRSLMSPRRSSGGLRQRLLGEKRSGVLTSIHQDFSGMSENSHASH